jgi:alkylation response protein AidB-like acyl-CoA dehydrogenase
MMYDYLLSEAGRKLKQEAIEFTKSIDRQYLLDMDNEKIKFPHDLYRAAAKKNLLGVRNPVALGGRGMNWTDYQALIEEIGVLGYQVACTFGVGPDLVCDAIVLHGNKFQQDKYVTPVLKGELFAAECLTEPRGGSDFFGATTTAEDKGGYYLINGQKRFIVGGEGADYFMVYARTDPDPKADPHKAISAFLVDRSEGVETKYVYGLMGCRGGGAARMVFNNVKIPKENLLGKWNGAYDIFNTMMIPERLGTGMMGIGSARGAVEVATKYTMNRKQFGKVINRFQAVSFLIADAVRNLDVSRAICHMTARCVDSLDVFNPKDMLEIRRMVSQAKKFATEACQEASRLAMQAVGGIGYTNIYPIERVVRDLALASIWTGTSQVMNLIASAEWYRKFASNQKDGTFMGGRDVELDAKEAFADDEKVYE